MKYRFHAEAREELRQATEYYRNISKSLGQRFLSEVRQAIARVSENPLAWSPHIAETRRCVVGRFPYGLVYSIEDDHILFLAVINFWRKPGYWIHRKL